MENKLYNAVQKISLLKTYMKSAPVLFWKTYITHNKLEALKQDMEVQAVLAKLLAGLYKSVRLEKLQVEGYTLFRLCEQNLESRLKAEKR